ncbi:IspD/TarI family cytidylyltransferase [Enterococcus faecium]|uniref:IspD/TarI family cytidylyltransferase n=1 Tax=Enterococcus faecium TaxID=1352 RepID=UPI002072F88D|nr:IspD/TarI family cytidylyltransferase [Enterococcus faecium]MCM6879959.1 2-C-methyl-D-erythritol 4-phosphate cytidylyltransferase [Enterococcus faecium]
MNVAVIIAGGTGSRMKQDIPKQFLNVNDKPIIVYTLQAFERHPSIDKILVVCLSGWEDILKAYAKQFDISKLEWIVSGGNSGQESIKNGVFFLRDKIDPNDIVIIHDGIRPLIDEEVISSVLVTCEQFGNGLTSIPVTEQVFIADNIPEQRYKKSNKYIDRDLIKMVGTPQAYKFELLYDGYKEAFDKKIGIEGSSYTNTMMIELGKELYLCEGSPKNIKLTTKDDFEIFKAYLKASKGEWLR